MKIRLLMHHSIALGVLTCLLSLIGLVPAMAGETVDREAQIKQRLETAEQQAPYQVDDNAKVRKDYHLNREYAINYVLLKQAKEAREKEDYATAKQLYQRVLGLAPKNQYALAGLKALAREERQSQQLAKAKDLLAKQNIQAAQVIVHDVLLENPQHPLARQLNEEIGLAMGDSHAQLPQLKAKYDKPISLEFRNANIKMVFDALSRDTGINFILDKDIRPDMRANIHVKNVTIDEAIDTVIASNGLAKKVTAENTVIIFPRNALKLKAYEELLIRNFYLNNTKAKDVADMLKSMIKTKSIFVYERLNMLVIRDRPEVIHLAEKLVASMDLAEPEVMMEIEVLEVTRSRLQELGIEFPNQLSVLNGAEAVLTLEGLKSVNQSRIGVSPNPAINFKKTVGDLNLLSNPRIRVKNNDVAKVMVGDRIPVITTTSTPNVGITENVEYQSVGLKLEVEPHITLNNFVDIKVGLEVSTLGDKTVTNNGTTVYAIGSRTANTSLRLKDGETQVLAGLILDDDRRNISKLPGLGDIPLLGRLFSNNDDSKSKTEIVLAITPRVMGNIPLPSAQFTEYWSGTANYVTDKIKKGPVVNAGSTNSRNTKPSNAFGRLMEQRRQRESQFNNGTSAPTINPATVPPKPANLLPLGSQDLSGNKQQQEDVPATDKKTKSFIPDVEFLN